MKKQETNPASYSNVTGKIRRFLFATGFMLMVAAAAHAQGGVEEDPDTPVPIDGGVSLLVAAGVGYGVKKWRDARKEKGTVNKEQ